MARTVRLAAAATALTVFFWGTPGPLLATLAPGQWPAGPELGDERVRLGEVRERLERRRAMVRTLHARIDRLDARLFELRDERSRQADTMSTLEAEIARVERELDALAPRVLARDEDLAARRRQAAQALADLAGLSRSVEVDPTIRARLLAISPLMLERLQTAQDSVEGLRERHERVLSRHRALHERLSQARAGEARLEEERAAAVRARDAAMARHQEMARELEGLSRQEEELARQVLQAERALAVQVDPGTEQAGWHAGPMLARAPEAVLGKQAVQVQPVMAATGEAASHGAATSALPMAKDGSFETWADRAAWPPPAKPALVAALDRARLANPLHGGLEEEALLEMASLEIGVEDGIGDAGGGGFSRPPRPIVPSPASLLDPITDAIGERPVITMPARPGQAVAAPDPGRVAFADDFSSYGLLLILEHERGYHTILWGFSELRVSTGDRVAAGDILGVMGGGEDRTPELHVEFRRNGRPVGLLPWLAASSSKVRG